MERQPDPGGRLHRRLPADRAQRTAGLDALEFADLFILKKYRRQGIGRALAQQVLSDGQTWLVRCYPDDRVAVAFWRQVLAELARPVRQIALDDEPELLNYLIGPAAH